MKKIKKVRIIKYLIINIVFSVILIALLISIKNQITNMYQPQKEEEKLSKEIEKVEKLLKKDELTEKTLNKTITKYDYAKVEKAYKTYLKDYIKVHKSITSFYETLNIENIMTIDNMKKDGKDFVETQKILRSYINQLEKLQKEYQTIITKKDLTKYIDMNMEKYYINYSKELINSVTITKEEQEWIVSMKESKNSITNTIKIFEYLANNKDSWEIKDDNVVFNSQEKLDEYNELLSK